MLPGQGLGHFIQIRSKRFLKQGAELGVIVYPFPKRTNNSFILKLIKAPGYITLATQVIKIPIRKDTSPPPATQSSQDAFLHGRSCIILLHDPNITPAPEKIKSFTTYFFFFLILFVLYTYPISFLMEILHFHLLCILHPSHRTNWIREKVSPGYATENLKRRRPFPL